ncbi:MAG: hypothetical protein EOO39_19035, partial [Cytophagaceae bacterium]
MRLQYTINGTTWINFNMAGANTTFCDGAINNGRFQASANGDRFRRISVNLSAIAGANNNANFGIRLLAAYYQGTGQFRATDVVSNTASTTGTWRFDNVAFTGTLVPGPNPSVLSVSGPTAYCPGGTTNLRVSITGGTGPFKVVYSNGTTNFTVNNYISNTNIPVSPAATTTYSLVSVTNANGVAGTGNSGTPTVTIHALPTVSATNITTCATGAVTLTGGSPAGGTYSIGNSYSGPSTTFTYSYTNGNGCQATSGPYQFTRNVAPTVTSQPNNASQTTCVNGAFSPLTVAASGTNPTFQWYSNATPSTSGGTLLNSVSDINNGSQTASFTPSSAVVGTSYYYAIVTGTCAPAVKSTISGAFTVSAQTVAGTVTQDQTICAGSAALALTLSGNIGSILKWQKADDAAFSSNVGDIAVTSPTLTPANIGTLTHTTYFRAIVQSGNCSAATTNVVTISILSTTWNGSSWSNGAPDGTKTIIFEGNYTSGGDLNACAAIVNSGAVVIEPDNTLTLLNSLTVNGGSLTFSNNASLVQVNNASNSGNITYKRDTTPIRKYDFTYWSSPVENQTLFNLSPLTRFDKYFWFNSQTYAWVQSIATTTNMDAGRGYIVRAPNDYDESFAVVYHANFAGIPRNGDFQTPIYVNGAHDFNLIGNPYPSAIDADLFMSDPANTAAIGTGTTLYFWTHNTAVTNLQYAFSDYALYNYTGGTGTTPSAGANNAIPNGYIASGQGFFIEGIA